MVAAEKTALILLAAGQSKRFGDVDKLGELFLGLPLASHPVTALEAVPFLTRVAVTSGTAFDFAAAGYRVQRNDRPEEGLSGSVRLGIRAAQEAGAAAAVIALADMPRITATHVWRLLDAIHGPMSVVASSNGQHPCPPAVFAAGRFAELIELVGQPGARELILGGHHVVTSPAELIDIDTPADLERLRALF